MSQETAIILGAIISAGISLLVVFVNQYFVHKKEKETKKTERDNALKLYSHPIIRSSEQLAWRLKGILEFKASFLLKDSPKNDYYYYKTNSTIYRLCSLLGWLQASKRENTYFNTESIDQHNCLQEAIGNFRNILADGDHIETSILIYLSKQFNIDLGNLNQSTITQLGVELESIVFKYISTNVKSDVKKLTSEKKLEMLKKVLDNITSKINKSPIKESVMLENIETAITEISRKFWWIYRDWQYAIGDTMLIEIHGGEKKFDILGYGDFIEIMEDKNSPKRKWLLIVSKLFEDLNVSIDDRFDDRVDQLKLIYLSLIEIIDAFKQIETNQNTIIEKSFNSLKSFAGRLEKPN